MTEQKTFPELYSSVIKEWPESIDISDFDSSITTNFGYFFPQLSSAWNRVDERFSEDTRLECLMAWSMFGIFQIKAMQLVSEGKGALKPVEIPQNEIEQNFWEYLQIDGWSHLKPLYDRSHPQK